MYSGDNVLMVLEEGEAIPRYFSRDLMCPSTGISYPTPEPNTFSFNSPKGMCNNCNGLGHVYEVNENKIFPNKKLSIQTQYQTHVRQDDLHGDAGIGPTLAPVADPDRVVRSTRPVDHYQ